MLLNIAMCILLFSDILGFTIDMHPEPNEISLEASLTRTIRDVTKKEKDDSSKGPFTVEPTSHLDDGVTVSIGLDSTKENAYANAFTDPEWKYQWYMHDYRTKLGPVMDLNVVPVYRMGYTGKGIYVAIVDSGVEMDHPDLQKNLVHELAYTAFTGKISNHGTNSAGVVGMTPNNTICGAGMAYDAKLVAINRKLTVTRHLDAQALSHARDTVDIYSCSWGPTDDGKYMGKIGKAEAMAIDYGTEHGRKGLGSIYTFPAGNGHGYYYKDDNCAADDMVNYIHTIAITGATAEGKRSQFSECCTAIYATTYSGGGEKSTFVTTTDLKGMCSNNYKATSAATPQASAIIALVLQANNKLTYRDVMHLITMSAEVAPLADNDSWYKNGAGFWVSNEFGFGLMNALNMVNWALNWTTVPEKTVCEFKFNIEKDKFFQMGKPAIIQQQTEGCQNSANLQERVFHLEQVMLTASVEHRYRGAISIYLTSPAGTRSKVLTPRRKDTNHNGLDNWNIKSVHNWGEDPKGKWQIQVEARIVRQGLGKFWECIYQTAIQPLLLRMPDYSETGRVRAITLWFHGTRDQPEHYKKGPRTYSAFRTADGKSSKS